MRVRLAIAAAGSLVLWACNSGNPVAPAPPTVPPASSGLSVTVTASQGSLVAGSTQGATITVTVRAAAGATPPADGTPVNINTSLGNFGVDASGKALQIVTRRLAGGTAAATFYAGSQTGTANILAQVGTSTGGLNLPVLATPAPLVADFTFQTAGLMALFSDASTGNPTGWAWDFGDGTAGSQQQNPAHAYAAAGPYTVTLTVSNGSATSAKSKFVTVVALPGVTADFVFQTHGLTALFQDQSSGSPTFFSWNFGDCGAGGAGFCTSTERNPTHTYLQSGTYTVTLTVNLATGSPSSVSKFVTVSQGTAPQADFIFQTTGLTAVFADQSTGGPTNWVWNFGDCASCTSLDQNPTHTYAASGTYTVSLTAANATGKSTKSKLVTVAAAPQADFTFQASGLNVVFADRSSGGPTSWSWNFGDCPQNPSCVDAKDANPTHAYGAAGTYTVTLTVANASGQSTVAKFVTVSLGTPPQAQFTITVDGLTIIFTDRSTGNPTAWSWDFGDCPRNPTCVSAEENPTHTYGASGTYSVTFTASNAAGSSTQRQFISVSPAPAPDRRQ